MHENWVYTKGIHRCVSIKAIYSGLEQKQSVGEFNRRYMNCRCGMAEERDAMPIRFQRSTDLLPGHVGGSSHTKDSHGVLSGPCGYSIHIPGVISPQCLY